MISTQANSQQEQTSEVDVMPANKKIQIEDDCDQEQALNFIRVMLEREQSSYSIPSDDAESSPRPFSPFVKPTHRKRMVEWCFAMVETMELRRETIERAINCIDRFVLLKGGRILLSDPVLYQRAVITSLYIMIKLHEEEAIPIQDMAFVCSGGDENVKEEDLAHTSEQLAAMEIVILNELGWDISPPTAYEYLAKFCELLKLPLTDEFDPAYEVEEGELAADNQEHSDTKFLLDLAIFEVQQNSQDYDAFKKGAFHNAYNAMMNALPMLNDGPEMAHRLASLLSTIVTDLERYRPSDSVTSGTSETSDASSSIFSALRKDDALVSEVSSDDDDDDDDDSSTSSDESSEDSDDESISLEDSERSALNVIPEDETIVETSITILRYVGSEDDHDMYQSLHSVVGGLKKLDLMDNESPSCVMDSRLIPATIQSSLVAQTPPIL